MKVTTLMKIFISLPSEPSKQPFARVTQINEFTGETREFVGTLKHSNKETGDFYFGDLRLDSQLRNDS